MVSLIEKTLVMILSGGKGERLYPLTRDRAKPSVPILGTYRIIDFSLSNCLNSGLRKIALLTQYKSLSLERHIQFGWSIFHPESRGYVISLPAQGRVGDRWYEGTADAVFQNVYSIQQANPEAVLVLSGDHIYKSDYRKLVRFYMDAGGDAVVMAKPVPRADGRRFGIIKTDTDHRVTEFLEKPKNPPPMPDNENLVLASMGIYLFRTKTLIRALMQDARNPKSSHDFGKDVIPRLIQECRVFAYPYKGYWEDIGTIDAYWKSNMDFLTREPPFDINDPAWPVRTYQKQSPPAFIDRTANEASIVSPGCRLCGASIRRSVLSPGIVLEEGSLLQDSIVFDDVRIGRKARLTKTIVEKHAVIPEGFVIGEDAEADARHFRIYGDGIRIIPKGWRLG